MNLQRVYLELSKDMEDEHYTELAKTEVLLIPVIIDIIHENSSNSYWAENLLEKISEKLPKLVYPYFGYIADVLNQKDSLVSRNIWRVISNLLSCDCENNWKSIKEKYFSALNSESVVAFSIACDCVEKVVTYKPEDKALIIDILKDIQLHKFVVAGEISSESNAVAAEKANAVLGIILNT